MSDAVIDILRERLHALTGLPITDADVVRMLVDVVGTGGGISIELDDGRWKLIRRDGRFMLKKDDARRNSTMPPRNSSTPIKR